jgi:hypothetical protein
MVLESGWRYCKAAWHTNGKVKPNIVLVNGVEETHRDGAYYLNHNQNWITALNRAVKFFASPPIPQRARNGWGTRSWVNTQLEDAVAG